MNMRFTSTVLVLAFCSFIWADNAQYLWKKQAPGLDQVPNCAVQCLLTLVPQYCGSFTNTSCTCTDVSLVNAMRPCAYAACNITEALRLQRFQQDSCGVKNDISRRTYLFQQVVTIIIFAALFVGLRCFARVKLGAGMGVDDWMMVAALNSNIILTAFALMALKNHFGEHTYYLTTSQLTESLRYFFLQEIFYHFTVGFTRLSIPLFFIRVFPAKNHRLAAWALVLLVATSHIAFTLFSVFQCVPLRGNWENWKYKTPPVKCADAYNAIFAAGGIGVVIDVMILIFPLPILWKLKLAFTRKVHLILIFCLGSFVLVCSTARLPTLYHMKKSVDPSWDQQPVAVWSGLECSIGMICGSLPACRSLAAYLFPRLKIILGSNEQDEQQKTTWRRSSDGKKNKNGVMDTTTTTLGSFIQLEDRNTSDTGIPTAFNGGGKHGRVGTVDSSV